jgi:hypothetical protein
MMEVLFMKRKSKVFLAEFIDYYYIYEIIFSFHHCFLLISTEHTNQKWGCDSKLSLYWQQL